MYGSKQGVAVQIKEKVIRAFYTHCYAHFLNLAVGDTMKDSPASEKKCCKTFISHVADYGCQVWDLHYLADIQNLVKNRHCLRADKTR